MRTGQRIGRLVACGVLLWAGGCEESTEAPTCGPEIAYGYIAGGIEAGRPVTDASVRAVGGSPGLGSFFVSSAVDQEGRFLLALPAGEYLLGAEMFNRSYSYSAAGADSGYRSGADILAVTEGDTTAVHFRFGTLVAEISIGEPDLEGEEVHLLAYRSDEDGLPIDCVAEVEQGVARFEMNGLPAAEFSLALTPGPDYELWGSGTAERIWLPGSHDRQAAVPVRVTAGETVTLQADLPGEAAELHGRVIGSWQTLDLAEPELTLLTSDSLVIYEARETDRDGSFRFEILLPERVVVSYEIEGSVRWIGGTDFSSATEFDLSPGAALDAGTIEESGLLLELIEPHFRDRLEFGLNLYRVTDGSIAHASWVSRSARTNLFPIPNLDPGDYYLHLSNSRLIMDWPTQWYDDAGSMEAATPVTIPGGGAVVPLTITLAEGGSIQGRVLNDLEDSPRNFAIYVVRVEAREKVGLIYSCSSIGRTPFDFTARGLSDGEYRVGAWPLDCDDFAWDAPEGTIWFPGTADWDSAGVVTVAEHGAVSGIDIAWPEE